MKEIQLVNNPLDASKYSNVYNNTIVNVQFEIRLKGIGSEYFLYSP